MPAVVTRTKTTAPREIRQFTLIKGASWFDDCRFTESTDQGLSADHGEGWQSDSSAYVSNDRPSEQILLAALGTSLTSPGPLAGVNQRFLGRTYPISGEPEGQGIRSLEFELNPIVNIRPPVIRRFSASVVATGRGKFSTSKYLRIE